MADDLDKFECSWLEQAELYRESDRPGWCVGTRPAVALKTSPPDLLAQSYPAKPDGIFGAMRRISLIELSLDGNEGRYLQQCIRENWVSSRGPFVVEFELALARLTGRAHAVATANGTAALHLALLGLGIRPGDHVIVPAWTFAATANAVCHAGAVPYFVDVNPGTWSLDPDLVEAALSREAGQEGIRAVIVVDVLGDVADFHRLGDICRRYGVALVEDAAGAIGARRDGAPAGSFGDASIFSFNGNKTVTAGGGGVVLIDDQSVAHRARHLSEQARATSSYEHDEIGFNYRMTNLNAAVGLAQLERLDGLVGRKALIAREYDDALRGRRDLQRMPRSAGDGAVCWLYSVRTADPAAAEDLVRHMESRSIEARVFWKSLPEQVAYRDFPRCLTGAAAGLSGTVVSVPASASLSDDDVARVKSALATWSGPALSVADTK